MSVQRSGATATPAVTELAPRGGSARAHPMVDLVRDDRLPDPFVDELAEELSKRLADRLAGRMAGLANRDQEDSSDEPRIPDGAKFATSEQLAARYQVSVQWVESRATNLGATPNSDSANSKLRYHLTTADAYMDATRRRPPPRGRGAGGREPKQKKRTHTRTGRPLLDVD